MSNELWSLGSSSRANIVFSPPIEYSDGYPAFLAKCAIVPHAATPSTTFKTNVCVSLAPRHYTLVAVNGAPLVLHASPFGSDSPGGTRLSMSRSDYPISLDVTVEVNESWVNPSFFVSTNTEFVMVHSNKGSGPLFLVTRQALSQLSLATMSKDPAASGHNVPPRVSTSAPIV